MKKLQTSNNKQISIGRGSRTVGLTSDIRNRKQRDRNVSTSRSSIKKSTDTKSGQRTSSTKGCAGCSRSARNK